MEREFLERERKGGGAPFAPFAVFRVVRVPIPYSWRATGDSLRAPFDALGCLVLQASAPSRILTVVSKGLIAYPLLDIEFDNLNGERKFSTQHAYYHSKQAQIMFTYDLAERLQGGSVTVNCVRVTNVAISDERLQHLPKWL